MYEFTFTCCELVVERDAFERVLQRVSFSAASSESGCSWSLAKGCEASSWNSLFESLGSHLSSYYCEILVLSSEPPRVLVSALQFFLDLSFTSRVLSGRPASFFHFRHV